MTRNETAGKKRRGPTTRFNKTTNVFSLRLTLGQRDAVVRASERPNLSLGDVACELIEQYADQLKKPIATSEAVTTQTKGAAGRSW